MRNFWSSVAVLLLVTASAVAAAPTAVAPKKSSPLETAKTIQVTEMVSVIQNGSLKPAAKFLVSLERPYKARFEEILLASSYGKPGLRLLEISDGTILYQYSLQDKQYIKRTGIEAHGMVNGMLPTFPPSGKLAGTQVLDGKPMLVYVQRETEPGVGPITLKSWVDKKSGLLYRTSTYGSKKGSHDQELERLTFTNWILNKPIDAAQFAWTPPAGVTEHVDPKVLADGAQAPDFTVQDRDGKPVKLSDYKGKVVVLDFWATWCGPCQESLPHTTKVAKKYEGKDVVVLAVNVWDTKAAFDKWLPQHPEYSALTFVIDPNPDQNTGVASALYGVSGIPTQFIIDKNGKVVKSFVGYGGPTNDLEKAIQKALAS